MHFEGFSFHRYLFRLVNISLRSAIHIVDVSFDIVADLLIEAHLDGPLVCRPGVLESEGHGGVAVRTERRD